MKLCASYHCKNEHLDEIRYPSSLLNAALEQILNNPNKTIILEILSLDKCGLNISKLKSLSEEQNNCIIDCYQRNDFIRLANMNVKQIMYHYPATNFNDLWFLIQYSPISIAISEPLTFNLQAVYNFIHAHNKNENTTIRTVPCLGRPSSWQNIKDKDNGLRHFWITPQAIPLYEQYIDVLDLYDENENREAILVDIYFKQQYDYPIATFIKHCESVIPAPLITEEIIKKRLNCKQICMLERCHYCDEAEKLFTYITTSQSES